LLLLQFDECNKQADRNVKSRFMLPLSVGCCFPVSRAQGLEYKYVMVDLHEINKTWTAAMINTAVTRPIAKPGEQVNLIVLNIAKGSNYVNRSVLEWSMRKAAETEAHLDAARREASVPYATRQVASFLASSLRHPEDAAATAIAFCELGNGRAQAAVRVAEILGAGIRKEDTVLVAGRKRLRQASHLLMDAKSDDSESNAEDKSSRGSARSSSGSDTDYSESFISKQAARWTRWGILLHLAKARCDRL
jgi:hypothetical protein